MQEVDESQEKLKGVRDLELSIYTELTEAISLLDSNILLPKTFWNQLIYLF